MSGDEFFRTRMGMRFYEVTMPKIADQLERLNKNFESLVAELQRRDSSATAATDGGPLRTHHMGGNSPTETDHDDLRGSHARMPTHSLLHADHTIESTDTESVSR